jgi:hypothetical protein
MTLLGGRHHHSSGKPRLLHSSFSFKGDYSTFD